MKLCESNFSLITSYSQLIILTSFAKSNESFLCLYNCLMYNDVISGDSRKYFQGVPQQL